jgi:transcriptional regulator of acetoin/glycerol metabolism
VALRNIDAGNRYGQTALSQSSVREERLNLERLEDRTIAQALAETKGNVTQAAKRMGMSRRTLHRQLKEMRASGAYVAIQGE